MKIVHVENDADTRSAVKDVFNKNGYQVISIGNPKKAAAIIKKEKPDLVLLDIMMPGMSGWDVYKAIRKIDKKVKVAFLSVLEISQERKDRLAKEGICGYIMKPFTASGILKTVKKIAKT